jgi:beta-N-acetylhexosaminidase
MLLHIGLKKGAKTMTLEEKIGRLFLIGIMGKELTEETKVLIDRVQPGFIILFQRNIQSKAQLTTR